MGRIELSQDGARQLHEFTRMLAPEGRRGLMLALGREVERVHRAHFRQREADSPNKRGWPRQHFWARIRTATALDESATTDKRAKVVVSDRALNTHIYGGTIRPKQKKLLAIPARAQGYGVRPSSGLIPGLFFVKTKKGAKFLAKKEGKQLRVYYWLKESVNIPKDPRALPEPAAVESSILKAAASYVSRRVS